MITRLLPFWQFCWCRGFCHRTGWDLLLFVFASYIIWSLLLTPRTFSAIDHLIFVLDTKITWNQRIRSRFCQIIWQVWLDTAFEPIPVKWYIYILFRMEVMCEICNKGTGSRPMVNTDLPNPDFTRFKPYFEAEYCLFCGRRRVTVARYRMICLVLNRFRILHTAIVPAKDWLYARHTTKLKLAHYIARLWTVPRKSERTVCPLCRSIYIDLLEHIIAICPSVLELRELFWTAIANTFSVDLCAELVGLSDDQFLITLLGLQTHFTLDQTEIYEYMTLFLHL